MSDAMQVAHQRRKDYKASIAKKEAEIEELNELVADLDSFMEFGEALMGNEPVTAAREVSKPVVQVTKPIPDPDPEDEWAENDGETNGIARVLSQRTG